VRRAGGEITAALQDLNEAAGLDPTNKFTFQHLGFTYQIEGDYLQAEAAFRRARALQPADPRSHESLAAILWELDRRDDSVRVLRGACNLMRGANSIHTLHVCARYALALQNLGFAEEARVAATGAVALPDHDGLGAEILASFWALSGDRSLALEYLGQSAGVMRNPARIEAARGNPDFASLRGHPDFEAILDQAAMRLEVQQPTSRD
jgi:tetratricopeptide (TPR) repeat protein